jgi:hypothetical protein
MLNSRDVFKKELENGQTFSYLPNVNEMSFRGIPRNADSNGAVPVRTNRNPACKLALSVLAWTSCDMKSKQER